MIYIEQYGPIKYNWLFKKLKFIMPYTYATADSDSDYESDGETHYHPKSGGHYQLDLHTDNHSDNKYKFGVIYLSNCSSSENTLNYTVRGTKETFSGKIPFTDIVSDIYGLIRSINNNGLIRALKPHTSLLIEILINKRHARKGYMACGTFSFAREFTSTINDKVNVVLEPLPIKWDVSIKEVQTKLGFFNTIYPDESAHLNLCENKYRLVLPKKPGVLYNRLSVQDAKHQIILCIATVNALEACHAAGLVVLDLKEDNILYLSPSIHDGIGTSYLIDGGNSVQIGETISSTFQNIKSESIEANIKEFPQIAPECWTPLNSPGCRADPLMDVYSMGVLFKKIFQPPYNQLLPLLTACQATDPEVRPSLNQLKYQLEEMLGALSADQNKSTARQAYNGVF